MFNTLKKRIKNEKGLSLVELLAVIVILGIVAAIAIPSIGNIIDDSRIKGVKADAANIVSAAQIYYADTGVTTGFTVPVGGASDYVNLGSAEVTEAVVVSNKGIISDGTIIKNGKKLQFTGDTTLEQLEVDKKSPSGTSWTITDAE